MEFCIQLSPYFPDKSYGGDRVFEDMLEQAVLADSLGYDSVSITEHHLMNILMMPAPLQFATQIAQHTEAVKIITSIAVLPLHDMRIYAGEVVCADIFTKGRLMLGVGRGAFAYEMERCGVPMDQTQPKFNESLDLLQRLLSEEEVSADGEFYKFDPITIMPRPLTPNGPQMMMAVLNPEGIYHCTKRGFHIQTTPLAGQHQLLLDQVDGFNRAKDEMGDAGQDLTLSLSRVGFVCNTQDQIAVRLEKADSYYARFDNVFTGPGIVENGLIKKLPRKQTKEELADSLLIGSTQEITDKLGVYADLGIDRFIFSCNFGVSQSETMENIQQFAEEIAPHFSPSMKPQQSAAQ